MTSLADEPLVFLNGRYVRQAGAGLSLHDAGFVMGATVTDLCRTFHRRLYRWAEHLERFGRSCRAAFLTLPLGEQDITERAAELLAHNGGLLAAGQELALVLFATPGPIGFYLGEPSGLGVGEAPATFGMHTFPLPWSRYLRLIQNGAALVVPNIKQIPSDIIDPRIKQRSRLHWWLADREVQRREPGAIALLLDAVDHVTETAAANFLVVRSGAVLSPPFASILEGISLNVVRRLCGQLAIPFAEQALTLDDCLHADEAMLTSTGYCLAGVSKLQGSPLRFPGPILARLLQAWNEEVGLDIHAQIDSFR